jgi:hypothetical protein
MPSEHTVLLHDLKELDNDLARWTDQDLALAGLLSVVDALERIVEDRGTSHLVVGILRFSMARRLRYLFQCHVRRAIKMKSASLS